MTLGERLQALIYIETLMARGFDTSTLSGIDIKVGCSQCAVMIINGWPCHETGCPNQKHLCAGCDTFIPLQQKYCEDCQ